MQLFKDYIKKYFAKVAKYYFETINGTKDEPKYLHDQMLDEEYSVDMTYESMSGELTRVTADVVAFDSPLPLKSRSVISKASGNIPKIGLKYQLNEKEMNTIRILGALKNKTKQIVKKIFNDVSNCIFGIKESLEEAFLLALSSGVTIIKDENNTGHGIRLDFNVPKSNRFGVTYKWDNIEAKPLDDIRNILKAAKAKGEYPTHIWMNSDTVALLCNNNQIKTQFAFNLNFVGKDIPLLDESQLANVLKRVLKLELRVVDRTFTKEKNGKKTVVDGWTKDMVVFTSGTKVGTLTYSTLAEEENPVDGVSYAKPNNYILIGMSGTTDPVSRKTTGQAIAFPILQNVESMFYLNSMEAQELDPIDDNSDSFVTIWGRQLNTIDVVNALNGMGKTTSETIKESSLITKVNKLSEEDEAKLKSALEIG